MASVLPGEGIIYKLQDFNNDTSSSTCLRIHQAYSLIANTVYTREVPVGQIGHLAQRVSLPLGELPCKDGCIKGLDQSTGLVEVVLDSGEVVHSNADDVIALVAVEDPRNDYVARMVWSSAISESRVPLSGEQIKADLSHWDMFEPAFQLSAPWTRELWTAGPQCPILDFPSWMYLFAESIRMRAMDSVMLALRIVEECTKQLEAAEAADISHRTDSAREALSFIADVGAFLRFCPEAVQCMGKQQLDTVNGAFSLLRFILSSHAVRLLRVLHRTPNQTDMGGASITLDRSMIIDRLRSDNGLRTIIYRHNVVLSLWAQILCRHADGC